MQEQIYSEDSSEQVLDENDASKTDLPMSDHSNNAYDSIRSSLVARNGVNDQYDESERSRDSYYEEGSETHSSAQYDFQNVFF